MILQRKALGTQILIVCELLATSCKTTTTITSTPSAATVIVNGKSIGETPVVFTTRKTTLQKTKISITAPGYQTVDTALSRNQRYVNQRIFAAPLLLPLLYLHDLNPNNHFPLQRNQAQVALQAEEVTPAYQIALIQDQIKELEVQLEKKSIKKRVYKKRKKDLESKIIALQGKD
jgi:hypothetical protein